MSPFGTSETYWRSQTRSGAEGLADESYKSFPLCTKEQTYAGCRVMAGHDPKRTYPSGLWLCEFTLACRPALVPSKAFRRQ